MKRVSVSMISIICTLDSGDMNLTMNFLIGDESEKIRGPNPFGSSGKKFRKFCFFFNEKKWNFLIEKKS